MRMHISMLCAAVVIGFVVSPAQSAESNLNASSGKSAAVSPSLVTTASATQLFTAIQPCRAFNTPAAVAAGQTLNFQVSGSGSLVAQGGPAGGCGIPTYATAVSINLSAVSPTGFGFFRAYAQGAVVPGTTVVSYRSGANSTGFANVGLNSAGRLSIFVATAATRVIGDVSGYYSPAIYSASIVGSTGAVTRAEGLSAAATNRLSTGTYEVGFTRDITECFFQVTAGEGGIGGATPRVTGVTRRSGNPNGVFVRITDGAGASIDNDFFVTVSCGR
ncbi:hypothetical protein [Methylopila sp. M107]|uniref:hypothetical protein n=1 Tax=Methylopila sp. M107 TaxID=1101190 RepID=UPI0003AAB615|nr:hypothetical protein [Methylopila sp. M107]